MSAITELQREIRERLDDPVRRFDALYLPSYRTTYSCGHTTERRGGWSTTCTVCHRGQFRAVFKP